MAVIGKFRILTQFAVGITSIKSCVMSFYYSRKLTIPFEEAIERITGTLKAQGFGIVTTLDIRDTLKKKLGIDFRNYVILGACNPEFAYQAISLESHMGVIFPCNVVVQQHENGEVEISAINPMATIDKLADTRPLMDISDAISTRLRTAVDNLHRQMKEEKHVEALPDGTPVT